MPPLRSRVTRELVKKRNVIEGPRSLHRGIHYNLNDDVVKRYKTNTTTKRADHRELLVHHQRINEDLQDIYTRTAALHADNATMEERIEERWRRFERIGGKRPPPARTAAQQVDAVLCVSPTAIPYARRLEQLSKQKRELRERAAWERETRGEAVDYSEGSALHAAKDRRIQQFQRRQLKRAHLLRRMGDPTPLKQAGRYDISTGTLQVFNKTVRQVEREGVNEERVSAVRTGRGRGRSQWDVVSTGNLNRPDQQILRYSRDWEVGPQRRKKRPAVGKKRSRSS